ncbi:hypothetical protein ACN2MM_08315 [Alkalilimnicola ehrlichii MLHE-1]|uniref:Organic solvent tolerance-like N-terminal domain-containing protein n=1 Tax=Alkalilimnicola ehrlichii (strain ATCC BAA-1101 / DSM 17681 / MLHE-1) TaxID=187272 RepID=Q0A8G5_ALKEH|nr:hypothetical protein [Alkalilimnicola ehrlichii]ABI56872.1 hypothetical protein Mlg_1523 [Alkalilimnicola ehrlichii MLHE-1]
MKAIRNTLSIVGFATLAFAATPPLLAGDDQGVRLSPLAEEIELTEKAVVIDNAWILDDQLLDLEQQRAQVVLERNEHTEAIEPGSVLLSEGDKGLFDEVFEVEVLEDRVEVITGPAVLTEAVERLKIEH